MGKILIVEDDDNRIMQFKIQFLVYKDVIITKSSAEAVGLVKDIKFDVIFLDHDLGICPETGDKTCRVFLKSGTGTGYEVAESIKDSINENTLVIIHSWNPAGANNMMKVIPNNVYAPFGTPHFNRCVAEIKNGLNLMGTYN